MRFSDLRPTAIILALLGWGLAGGLYFPPLGATETRQGLTLSDLLTLSRTGLAENIIEREIDRLGLAFQANPVSILALKEAGYSEAFLAGIVLESGLSHQRPEPVETVRVFEEVDSRGRRILVLTNLDEDGNRIVDPNELPGRDRISAPPYHPPPPPPPPAQIPVESYVAAPPPIVVVHVEAPSPVPTPWSFQPVWAGSIAGSYQYPLNNGFLGYGTDIASPGWFSGLGLNPSNNFGHRQVDKPNQQGLGAFFGPSPL